MNTSAAVNANTPPHVTQRRRFARWLVRCVLLVAAVVMLLPMLQGTWLPLIVPALSPFVSIASLLATRTLQVAMLVALPVVVLALFRRRWFCRWVCPTGTCADCATLLGTRLHLRCPRIPPLGQWIALVTFGGAVLGYPLLLWLDPMALFSGLFNLSSPRTDPAVWWSVSGMAAVLLVSFVWPGAWCVRICPLGATQDLLAWLPRATRFLLVRPNEDEGVPREPAGGIPRRAVLGASAGVCWAAIAKWVRGSATQPLRPPGAVDESRFVGVCIRCGNCLRACPANIIRPDQGQHGVAGLLTPVLDFSEDYCREDCTICTEVCPSGALTPLTLEDKKHATIGLPQVNMDLCLLGDDRDCFVCQNWCPYQAIKLHFDEVEYTLTPQIDPQKCPGCGACEFACPTEPVKAIVVVPQANEPS